MSTIIEMPKLSDTMTVGTVVKWHKQIGDKVSNGDILAEVETDKATMELENFDDGVLLQLMAEEGDEVEIGKPLAIVGEPGESIPELNDSPSDTKSTGTVTDNEKIELTQESVKDISESDSPPTTLLGDLNITEESSERIIASPLAKKIAKDNNLDLSKIKGSGPRGRITKKDLGINSSEILTSNPITPKSLRKPHFACTSLLQSKTIPVSKIRSVIARRLLESKDTDSALLPAKGI